MCLDQNFDRNETPKRDDRSTETRLLFLIENVLQIFCRYRRSLVHFTSRFALSDDSVS